MAVTIAVPEELIAIVPEAHPDVALSPPAVSRWKFQFPNRSPCAKAPPRFRKIIRALPPALSVQVADIMVLSFDRKPWKVLSMPIPTMPQGNIENGTLSMGGQGMPFRIKDVMPPIPVLYTERTPCIQPMVPEVAREWKSQAPWRSPMVKAAPERNGGIDRFSPPAIMPGYPIGSIAGKAFPLVKSGRTIPRSMIMLFAALVIRKMFVDPM
jgi:hypothetical protein